MGLLVGPTPRFPRQERAGPEQDGSPPGFRHSTRRAWPATMRASYPSRTQPMSRALLLACALLGCLAASASHAAAGVASPAIELVPGEALWEVRYTLPAPARELRFVRVDAKGRRAASWAAVDPALAIALEDGEEVVRRTDGAAFDRAAFRMAPRYVELEKDYAPFAPFGDGGMLVHTGRFHACAGACTGGETFPVSLQPPEGAHAIVHGQVVDRVRFEDRDNGTNLYVGRALPVATPDVVAVVDAAFPADTRARLESLLPRLMAFYGKELGALPSRPMLFASRDEDHPGGGYGYQGGTLPGQVFMHFYGRNAAFATPEFATRVDWFFAHEAAHLYQQFSALEDPGDSWIHEGGADALAAVALQSLGVIDAGAVDARVSQSVDACAKGIAARPLQRAHADGAFDAYYSCGFVMQMAVDAAARRASDGACGLACVWRGFQAEVAAGQPWTGDTFIAVVARLADARTAGFVRTISRDAVADPSATLRDGLAQAGWKP